MNPEFAYFLKVNVAFALFYAFYRLCFYKDTFFKMRRTILLAFFVLAFLYPLLNIQEWIKGQEPIVEMVYVYASIILPEMTITATGPKLAIDWTAITHLGLICLYVGMVLALVLRFLLRLGSIIWLARQSRRIVLHNTVVYALPRPAGPFSFFRLIFLHPGSHPDKETDEILTHERTHVSQWHSVDVVVSELICILCWFNPFVWLIKREVRHNLEYLADNRVIQSGYDSRNYQYHLLGLAHHHPEKIGLYNSFNVMHIKNRILMMNKKRSHGFGRTKYVFIIPLVASLMILNNIGALARMNSLLPVVNNESIQVVQETLSGDQPATAEQPKPAITSKQLTPLPPPPSQMVVEDEDSHIIFTAVESMPRFPGGDTEMLSFIRHTLNYPIEAHKEGIQGRVICTFVVSPEGSIGDIQVARGVHEAIDREAVRVIAAMPKWEPGRQRGRAVSVKYTLPVTFRPAEDYPGLLTEEDADKVFTVVEKMPLFPGGENRMMEFLYKNIKYPVLAQENGIQGRVICTFVVNSDGSIVDPEIVRGVDPSLDREAIRVVTAMPKWAPGEQRGKPVRVKYTLPVQFRLQ